MSWLVDTDVVSQPAKKSGDPRVIKWLEDNLVDCYTSTVVIAQLSYWLRNVKGSHQREIQAWLADFKESMEGRILSFNLTLAHVWAEQKYVMAQKGLSMPVEDSYIAATARRHGLTIVTGNEKDFAIVG